MLALDTSAVTNERKALFERLVSHPDAPVFVFGRNKYAQRVAGSLPVEAFIDDYTREPTYLGRPVVRLVDLPRENIVVSCVMDTLSVTAMDRLRSAGVREIIDYFTLSRLAPDTFEPVEFCAANRQDILANAGEYQWVYGLLADETSQLHFSKVVNFRLSMNLEHMRGFELAIGRQYFEDFLPLNNAEVFVDGGGYDGQTTIQFAHWNQKYRQVHYFEPAPQMMEKSRQRLSAVRDIHFVQKGLFSRNDHLRFNADAGLAGCLSPGGQIEIEVVRLDDEIDEPVTFMKFDLEGAEYEALEGAANHIRSGNPKLAVCIYHNQPDFWRIPKRILKINRRYKIYVRHYSESIRETVMFFIPRP